MYIIIIYILIMDEILSIYKKYNRPGAQKSLQLAKSEGIQTTLKDIKEFISSRTEEQQLKESRQGSRDRKCILNCWRRRSWMWI